MRIIHFNKIRNMILFLSLTLLLNFGLITSAIAEPETTDDSNISQQKYLFNISHYEPIYFDIGTDPAKSKFQISFRYRFINTEGEWAKHHPWMTGLNLGYTQTSFWDLKSDSKPFEDTSYKPEIFYLSKDIRLAVPSLHTFRFQTGFQHESNGRGGDNSRSTNYLYFKPTFIFNNTGKGWQLYIEPKASLYVINDNDTNPDIEDYRGYLDLTLKFSKSDNLMLSSNIRKGSSGGSLQVDFTYPLSWLFHRNNLDLYFHAQYFTGYGENILHYNEKNDAIRLGVAIIR